MSLGLSDKSADRFFYGSLSPVSLQKLIEVCNINHKLPVALATIGFPEGLKVRKKDSFTFSSPLCMLAALGPGHLECCSSTFPGLEAGSLEVTSNVLQTFPVHLQVTIETPEWEKHLEISLSKTQRADPARDCAPMFRFEDQRTDCAVPLVHLKLFCNL